MATGKAARITALGRLPGWPLMLCDVGAASYLGLPVDRFLRAVDRCELPQPQRLAGLDRWNRGELERWLDPSSTATLSADHDPIMAAISAAEVR